MRQYIGILRKEKKSSYGVEFPDFPGCISGGETLDEAARNAAGALALHVEGMLEDGDKVPAPCVLDDIVFPRGSIAILVPLEEPSAKFERINITVEANLLERIDAKAKALGESRSGFLAKAARRAL